MEVREEPIKHKSNQPQRVVKGCLFVLFWSGEGCVCSWGGGGVSLQGDGSS